MKRVWLVGVLVLVFCCYGKAQTALRIISYNVENLFDVHHDSLKQDTEFTPEGARHWTYTRYRNKLQQIARVIANIGEWDTPALIGLCEVESEQCLKDLCINGPLRNYGYRYIHQDSPDWRGIDCALLYHAKQFQLVTQRFITLPMDDRPTRDILYAAGVVNKRDTLHAFVCHFPSQRGGTAATAIRRQTALHSLQIAVDSLLCANPASKIVVMGDFNAPAEDNLQGMYNLMFAFEEKGEGTYKYQGIWNCLDQFYVSSSLVSVAEAYIYAPAWLQEEDRTWLGTRPLRTYQGYRYQSNGYSDHLPIYLNINL